MPKCANPKKYIQLICLLAFSFPVILHAENSSNLNNPTEIAYPLNDDDLLVISVEYGELVLEESLFVFQTPEATFIPVQGLIDTLNFALNLDLDALTIDGWFISESSLVSIDIANKSVFIRGEKQIWPNTFKYAEDGFDLYIDHHSLESWLGLSLSLDVSQLSIQVRSDTELPIVLKKQRQNKQDQINQTTVESQIKDYVPNTYDMIGDPSLDIEISYDLEKNQGNSNAFSGAVLQGTMDLFKHSMSTSYVNLDGEADLRATFSRAAGTLDESMPLGIDQYRFGDVFSRSDTLLFGSAKGSGFHIQRGKNSLLDQSGDILIEGDAPPGWEVELYRNGTLINFTSPSANGLYRFENVATFSGENIFDIRIFGPQGQARTRQKKITVGAGMLKKDRWEYQLYGLKKNNNLISSTINSNQKVSDFLLLEGSYGFNEYLTFQTGVNRMTPNNALEPHDYQFLSAFTSIDGSLLSLKFANDTKSGTAFASSLKGRWLNTNLNIDVFKFNNLVSDRSSNGQLKLDAKIKANSLIHDLISRPISYDLELRFTEQRASKQKQFMLSNTLSSYVGRMQFASSLNYSHSNSIVDDAFDGKFSVIRRFTNWRTKAELSYGISPTSRLHGVLTSASYKFNNFTYQASVDYLTFNTGILTLSNTFTWSFRPLAMSLLTGFNDADRHFIGLSLTTSLTYDKTTQDFIFDKNGFSSSARVLARAYIDDNSNQQFDENDQALEGIIFKGRNEWKTTPTDSNGYALLTGIPNQTMQRISIDESSIDDPFMRVITPQYYLYSHAGKQNELSFQLVPTLELEGQMFRSIEGKQFPSANVPLFLYDKNNALFASTNTEYDGIYLFDNIIPGKYRLEVSHPYLQKHQYSPIDSVIIEADGSEGVIYLPTIILEKTQTEKDTITY